MKKLLPALLACLLTAACAAQGEPDLPVPSPTLTIDLPRTCMSPHGIPLYPWMRKPMWQAWLQGK